MATSAREGSRPLRPGEISVLPPELPRLRRERVQPVASSPGLVASTAIAVVVTLNLDAVYAYPLGQLPPSIRSAVGLLDRSDWTSVCREAARAQSQLLDEACGVHRDLRHSEPWPLADFLPTSRS
jgi:hypothetical protein